MGMGQGLEQGPGRASGQALGQVSARLHQQRLQQLQPQQPVLGSGEERSGQAGEVAELDKRAASKLQLVDRLNGPQ